MQWDKLLSGRYYLTIIGGIAFLYSIWKGLLPPEATASILVMIFMSYFQRADRNKDEAIRPRTVYNPPSDTSEPIPTGEIPEEE